MQTPSTTYTFTYGDFSLAESVKIGSRTLVSYTYDEYNRLKRLDYGNGDGVEYTYDTQGNVIRESYEDGNTVSYLYDNDGALSKVIDSATGITTTYYYDFSGRLMKYTETGTDYSLSVSYLYSDTGNLLTQTETVNGVTSVCSYTYDEQNRVSSMTAGGITVQYAYDAFGRQTQQTVLNGSETVQSNSVGYTETDTAASEQVASYNGYTYTYDDNGNILSVSDGTNTTSYVYDSQNQLVRENNPVKGKTYTWTYDSAGNILSRKEYAYTADTLGTPTDTVTYGYTDAEWGDLLTAYDGNAVTYDSIGNPLSDGTWTYTWEHGRQLSSMSKGSTTWTYTYDANGMRTGRKSETESYEYIYNGSQLTHFIRNGTVCHISYDANGSPLTISFNNKVYYYVTNLQGDVVGIKNSEGVQVTTYTYDAFGKTNITSTDPVILFNPLAYRGYVYDRETGLYYLQSRYYNPEWGRFINADGQFNDDSHILGANLFAYCNNNPVNEVDPNGQASYKNTISKNRDGSYNIKSVISFWWTKITCSYKITRNGVIKFAFANNNYWSVLWRGGSSTLAAAMYKAAKAINNRFLFGRSISGLNTELQLHYIAYTLGIKRLSSQEADMGATSSGRPGYDSNAWFFETANAERIIARYNINYPYQIYSNIKNIARYF